MYNLTLDETPIFHVIGRKHQYHFASDGSLPNPLDMTYASLVGCAGVYAKKACQKIGKSAEGIQIKGKIVVSPENTKQIQKWVTQIHFPKNWSAEEKKTVIDEIQSCAVKELIQHGAEINFVTEEELNNA